MFENKPSISSKSYLLPKSCFGTPIRRDWSSSAPPPTRSPPCASAAIRPSPAASARSRAQAPPPSSPGLARTPESPRQPSSPAGEPPCSPAFAAAAPSTPERPPAYAGPVDAQWCTHRIRRCVFAPRRDRDKRDALCSTEPNYTTLKSTTHLLLYAIRSFLYEFAALRRFQSVDRTSTHQTSDLIAQNTPDSHDGFAL